MKPPRESDGPGSASGPWWAWLIIGFMIGCSFAVLIGSC